MGKPAYLFAGSRKWTDKYIVDLLMCGLHYWSKLHREKVVIVHGAATGADTLADQCAQREGMTVHDYPADWDALGKRAGPIRNTQMLDEENVKAVFAFTDDLDSSPGTRTMCNQAHKRGVPVYVITRFKRGEEA